MNNSGIQFRQLHLIGARGRFLAGSSLLWHYALNVVGNVFCGREHRRPICVQFIQCFLTSEIEQFVTQRKWGICSYQMFTIFLCNKKLSLWELSAWCRQSSSRPSYKILQFSILIALLWFFWEQWSRCSSFLRLSALREGLKNAVFGEIFSSNSVRYGVGGIRLTDEFRDSWPFP